MCFRGRNGSIGIIEESIDGERDGFDDLALVHVPLEPEVGIGDPESMEMDHEASVAEGGYRIDRLPSLIKERDAGIHLQAHRIIKYRLFEEGLDGVVFGIHLMNVLIDIHEGLV